MKWSSLLIILITSSAFAALPNYTNVWEVQQAGSDSNGGCFDSAKSGTDWTRQNSPQYSFSDLVIDATTNTKVTSASHTFDSTDVGDCVHDISGTGFTAGWFEIVSTAGGAATLDRSAGTLGSTGGVWKEGGALATVGQANTNFSLSIGPTAWVKNDATYSISSMINLGSGAPNDGFPVIIGYGSTRGDGGRPTLQAAAGLAGSDNFILRFSAAPQGMTVMNFILDCNGKTFTGGLRFASNFDIGKNIFAENCSDPGFRWDNNGYCERCTTTNTPAAGVSGRTQAFFNNNVDVTCVDCAAMGSTVNNVNAFDSFCGGFILRPIVAHFTGTSSNAFQCTTQEGNGLTIMNATIYDVTNDAFRYGENTAIDERPLLLRNWAVSNIGGYCFEQVGSLVVKSENGFSDHNACNTTGATGFYHNWPAGASDVTLSTSPFINGGSNDFRLNNAAGGGKLLRSTGFPGSLTDSGQTSFLDFGAVQHGDPKFRIGVGF